jgi:hypothetical protein
MIDPAWIDAAANLFSAVGTVGALAVALVLLRQEQQREALRSEEQRRSQAVKVSAWLEALRSAHGGQDLFFHVHNASEMPIFEVSLPTPVPDEDETEAVFIGLVPPGQTIQRPAPKDWLSAYFSPEPVQIEFLDSSGQQWTRDEQGALTRSA